MQLDTSYLNRTANKYARDSGKPTFVVFHETASPNPDNPYGTLNYNLSASIQSSYNYLIARDGRVFHYVDEQNWIAYHAGLRLPDVAAVVTIDGVQHRGFDINRYSIGVELDGRNNGTPVTEAQMVSAGQLAAFLHTAFGIPLDRQHHLGHKELADPSYKTDPQGCRVEDILARATPAPVTDATVIGVSPSISLAQFLASAIIPVLAPASDGNNVPAYIASVLQDLAYIRAH